MIEREDEWEFDDDEIARAAQVLSKNIPGITNDEVYELLLTMDNPLEFMTAVNNDAASDDVVMSSVLDMLKENIPDITGDELIRILQLSDDPQEMYTRLVKEAHKSGRLKGADELKEYLDNEVGSIDVDKDDKPDVKLVDETGDDKPDRADVTVDTDDLEKTEDAVEAAEDTLDEDNNGGSAEFSDESDDEDEGEEKEEEEVDSNGGVQTPSDESEKDKIRPLDWFDRDKRIKKHSDSWGKTNTQKKKEKEQEQASGGTTVSDESMKNITSALSRCIF